MVGPTSVLIVLNACLMVQKLDSINSNFKCNSDILVRRTRYVILGHLCKN